MSQMGPDDVLDTLHARRADLKRRYLRCRQDARELITSDGELTEVTYDVFAAGQAALEQALEDFVIDWREHATLSGLYTAFFAHLVDEYSECRVGFDAKFRHPFGEHGATYEIDAYLELAKRVRDDLRRRADQVGEFYDVALRVHSVASNPYTLITAATLALATSRAVVDRLTAGILGRYFSFLDGILDEVAFGLLDVAVELGRAMGIDVSNWERMQHPEAPE